MIKFGLIIIGLSFYSASVFYAMDYGAKKERLKYSDNTNKLLVNQHNKLSKQYEAKIEKLQKANEKLNYIQNNMKSDGLCFTEESLKIFYSLIQK